MNDEEREGGRIGVSGFLPPVAADALVRASRDAKAVGWDNPVLRAKIIDSAIGKVKKEYPRYFRTQDDSDSQRCGTSNRRGSRERSLFEL
jgi:hypothetical protein